MGVIAAPTLTPAGPTPTSPRRAPTVRCNARERVVIDEDRVWGCVDTDAHKDGGAVQLGAETLLFDVLNEGAEGADAADTFGGENGREVRKSARPIHAAHGWDVQLQDAAARPAAIKVGRGNVLDQLGRCWGGRGGGA